MRDLQQMREQRLRLNETMRKSDDFFEQFGSLDDSAYQDGAVDRKHKELMGLAISVAARCEECVLYHVDGARDAGASREEIVETIKVAVAATGSVSMPTARFAFEILE